MTVYELIQELAQHDADREVVFDFTTKDSDVELEEDKPEGSTVIVDGEEKTGTDCNVTTFSYEGHKKVHIEIEED